MRRLAGPPALSTNRPGPPNRGSSRPPCKMVEYANRNRCVSLEPRGKAAGQANQTLPLDSSFLAGSPRRCKNVPHLDELTRRILAMLVKALESGQHNITDSDLRDLFRQQGIEPRFESVTLHFISLGILQRADEGIWRIRTSAKELWDFLPRAVSRPTPCADETPCTFARPVGSNRPGARVLPRCARFG